MWEGLSPTERDRLRAYVSGDAARVDDLGLSQAQQVVVDAAREAAIDGQVDAIREIVARVQEREIERGYFVRNRTLPEKAYNNTLGRLQESASQDVWAVRERALDQARAELATQGVEPDDPRVFERAAELANETERERYARRGSSMADPLTHTPEHFTRPFEAWRGGQCGEFAEWGAQWTEAEIRALVGEDAIISQISLERNTFSNHRATRVILPSGERLVIDFWEGVGAGGEPRVYREAEWLARWERELRVHGVSYGEVGLIETDLTDLERQLADMWSLGQQRGQGEQEILELFVTRAGDDPAQLRQREIIVESYRRNGLITDRLDDLARGRDRADRQGMYDAARNLLDAPVVADRIEAGELTRAEVLRDWARRGSSLAERDARQVVAAALEEHLLADYTVVWR